MPWIQSTIVRDTPDNIGMIEAQLQRILLLPYNFACILKAGLVR